MGACEENRRHKERIVNDIPFDDLDPYILNN